ncbi:hypothetical protein [Pedococcus bigeumensis]|uniref:hypothetical protein n=1 Tax=Pedococcus bigeumensis TaxID=433644 RepID=UPI001128BDD6|nr:hypothetical protein [Pedococcus bigeumensis]
MTLLLGGCIAPALDRGAFEQNAKSALESAASETSTAQIAVDALLSGNATNAYADTVVTDSENAMGGIETSFGVVDPPTPTQDPLREQVLTLLGDADDALAHARIAIRRGDASSLTDARKELDDASAHLESARADLK